MSITRDLAAGRSTSGAMITAESLFSPLTHQRANLRRWNEQRDWGFTAEDFAALDVTPADHRDPFVVDLFAVYLPDEGELDAVRRTCHELWTLAAEQQPSSYSWDEHIWRWRRPGSPCKPVGLWDGLEHRPGLRRVTLDLAAHWVPGRSYVGADVRGPDSAHAEVLAAAAHFPYWVWAMDGVRVPYAYLAGYQVTYPERLTDTNVLCLTWSMFREQISLATYSAQYYFSRFSAPELR